MIGPLLTAIATPIVGAFLLPPIGRLSKRLRNVIGVLLLLVSFVCSAMMLPAAMAGMPVTFSVWLPLGLSFGFLADSLAVFMAMISSFIGAIIVFYSASYLSHDEHTSEYYLMVSLFLGAMMGLVYSTNLIVLY
ncbi:MAG: hypothetical protein FWD72_04935, partial [Eggerthellaceae bacterium]|nr:hypothetical protein [Eggerthellaceae bacterium]